MECYCGAGQSACAPNQALVGPLLSPPGLLGDAPGLLLHHPDRCVGHRHRRVPTPPAHPGLYGQVHWDPNQPVHRGSLLEWAPGPRVSPGLHNCESTMWYSGMCHDSRQIFRWPCVWPLCQPMMPPSRWSALYVQGGRISWGSVQDQAPRTVVLWWFE